ncbi:MAG: ATP-binding cassette domain-containing protein [Chloroflexi bacterium]|nr:ATP-binding cassette domain-containing protein [Chloroflexota bacterium]
MNDAPFVLCENLVKIHKVANIEVVALQGLDLRVQRGELLGIVGSSGSGKSTLLNVLGGLDRPSAGKALVGGHNLLTMSARSLNDYRRGAVGFVWQQGGRNLVPYLTARQNVELPMLLAGRSLWHTSKRAVELLDAVGLSKRMNHTIRGMSGGEQQRAAIAIALANEPPLLLADEPTGELDSATALMIYQLFRDIQTRYGVTVIIVSHDREIARHVDRVVGIQDGKVATEIGLHTGGVMRTVLDSAGRLQLPKAVRQQYGIASQVTIETTDEGILVKPVEE